MWVSEGHPKKYGNVQKGAFSPALRPLEGKAAAVWTGREPTKKYVRARPRGRMPLAGCSPLPGGKFGEDGNRGMIDSPKTLGVGFLDIVINVLL
jgi:hypothetical protein